MTISVRLTRKDLTYMWLKLLEFVDDIIDNISMYRLMLYYLIGLLGVSVIMAAVGLMHVSAVSIAISAGILVFASYLINKIFAAIFNAPVNPESSILTGLILALIVPPSPTGTGLLFLLAVAGLAIASKYILSIKQKHIFNPAAIAVVLTAIGPRQSASWWVGTAVMLPFVILGGILIARKVRSEQMIGIFLLATTLTTVVLSLTSGGNPATELKNMILYSSVFFLGFVMLTEPYTSPTTQKFKIYYAIIVGVIMAPQVHIGNFYPSPEQALIVGNLFAYIVGSKVKLFPTLFRKYKLADSIAEFSFIPDLPLDYKPGQYMEFTLPHDNPDARGVRRYLTLSSSPTEEHIKIGVKFYDEGSTFKAALLDIDQNTPIVASELSGDFVMPDDPNQKLLFIAGGIGITPFRSMIKYLIDTNQPRDVVMLYSVKNEDEIAYRKDFDEAGKKIGSRIFYMLSGRNAKPTHPNTFKGKVSPAVIEELVPDFEQRVIYISGTHHMVEELQHELHQMGVVHANIKTDFFPGYA